MSCKQNWSVEVGEANRNCHNIAISRLFCLFSFKIIDSVNLKDVIQSVKIQKGRLTIVVCRLLMATDLKKYIYLMSILFFLTVLPSHEKEEGTKKNKCCVILRDYVTIIRKQQGRHLFDGTDSITHMCS